MRRLACIAIAVAGCGETPTMENPDQATNPDMTTVTPPDMAGPVTLLKHESKSSAIAISDDDRIVAAVSPDDDKLYLIDTSMANAKKTVQLAAGAEPRSVAYAPDGSFWVANRGNGTLVHVTGITGTPAVGPDIAVGAEPTAVAVAPTGRYVVVANYADGTVTVFDNQTSMVFATIPVGPNPRAVAITNNGKGDDLAETMFVTLMFGQAVGGNVPSEGNDVGRQGIVMAVKNGVAPAQVKLGAIADTGFKVPNKAMQQVVVGAYPNQLQGVALHNGRGYVTSTAASPAGPVNNAGNVHPFVSVFDVASLTEKPFGASGANPNTRCGVAVTDKTAGYAAGTLDLAIQTRDLNGMANPPPVLFPTIPVDIAFVPQDNLDVAYVVSMASDEVVRLAWDYTTNTACMGAPNAKSINLESKAGDFKVPIGIVVRNDLSGAYVNSWAGREVERIDFAKQQVTDRIALSADPGTPEQEGKKLFWTSTGRWSKTGWGSCGACHPDGLSDNVTFVFATGPRQTLPLDSDYAKTNGVADPTDQRILNWSAIFDEIHDFENNTRGVSGGLGAVVSVNNNPIDLAATKDGNVSGSVKQLAADGNTTRPTTNMLMETVDTKVAGGWDKIDAYVRTLRSLRHAKNLNQNAVDHGKMLYAQAGCATCHGGAKWTISRRPYTPQQGAGMGSATCTLQTTALAKKSVPTTGALKPQNTDVFQEETEKTKKACAIDADCQATALGSKCIASICSVLPARVTCSLRDVGTFGAGAQGAAFEVRSDTDAMGTSLAAQGSTGFNPPSLLSLAATAPYLHNGAAQTLDQLFTNAAFQTHWESGNPNFAPTPQDAADLAAFLLSIDEKTPVDLIIAEFDLCTGSFAPNMASVCPVGGP